MRSVLWKNILTNPGARFWLLRAHRILLSFFTLTLSFFVISCGGPPQYLDEGQESPASLNLAPGSVVDFGTTLNGFNYQFTVSVQNASTTVGADNIIETANLSGPFAFAGGSYPGTGGTCASSLSPLSICTIVLDVNPTANGRFDSSVTLDYNDGVTDQSFTMNLTTLVRDPIPATLAFTPPGPHDYGIVAVGSGFSDATFTINNTGELPATALNFTGLSAPFSMTANSCIGSIPALGSCSVTVRFAPLTQVIFNQTLSLGFNDGTGIQNIGLAVSGQGRDAGFLVFDEGYNFDFGILNAGETLDQIITVRNTGNGNATGITVNAVAAPLSMVSNTCPATLTPTQSCTVTLRYSPVATLPLAQIFNVDYNNGFNPQNQTANFAGHGFANPLILTLINPAASPSNEATPTIRVTNGIGGVRIRLYRDASCATQVANSLFSGTQIDFTPTMAEGTYQFHARAEDESGNLTICSASFLDYIYDNTPPQPPNNISYTNPFTNIATTSPTITWTATSPDVVDYQVGISSGPGGGNDMGGFTSKGNVFAATQGGLALVECNQYYASVQSIDHVGLASATFNTAATPFTFDSAPPTDVLISLPDGDATTTNSATITWTPSTDNCGLQGYEVTVYQDLNVNGVLDAAELAAPVIAPTLLPIGTTSHRFNAVTLVPDVFHWTSVRALDNSNLYANYAISNPWIAFNPATLPDMIVWLDGNDQSTIIDNNGRNALDPLFNNSVATWQDKSGSPVLHNFTSVGTRPTYNTTSYSMTFAASNSGFTTADHAEINTAMVTQRNLSVAFQTGADIATRQVVYEEGGSIRGMNIYIFNNRLYCGFYNTPAGDGDGVQPFVWTEQPIAPNTNYFVTWVYDYSNYTGPTGPDGALRCYVNHYGAVPPPPLLETTTSRLFGHSGDVGVGQIDNDTCFEDGSCPSNGRNFLGRIYEVMLFNNTPSDLEVFTVHTYLNNKWN